MSGYPIDFAQASVTSASGTSVGGAVFMNNGSDFYTANGPDTIAAGLGPYNNTVVANGTASVVLYQDSTGSLTFTNGSGSSQVFGTSVAGAAGMFIEGGTGRVIAYGGTGNDTISGGKGIGNVLVAGSGSDVLFGQGTSDVLSASRGNATLISSGSNDTLYGGSGANTLSTTDTSTSVIGGLGTNHAEIGANTNYFVQGASGANDIYAGFALGQGVAGGTDLIVGFRAGTDQLFNQVNPLTPSFVNGFYSTTLGNGVTLDVFAAPAHTI